MIKKTLPFFDVFGKTKTQQFAIFKSNGKQRQWNIRLSVCLFFHLSVYPSLSLMVCLNSKTTKAKHSYLLKDLGSMLLGLTFLEFSEQINFQNGVASGFCLKQNVFFIWKNITCIKIINLEIKINYRLIMTNIKAILWFDSLKNVFEL